jgi:hypothetical protein
MNHYAFSWEVVYRRQNLHRTAMRLGSKTSTRPRRRWWLARRHTTIPEPIAPLASRAVSPSSDGASKATSPGAARGSRNGTRPRRSPNHRPAVE